MSNTQTDHTKQRGAQVIFALMTIGVFVCVSLFLILIDFIPEPVATEAPQEPRVVLYDATPSQLADRQDTPVSDDRASVADSNVTAQQDAAVPVIGSGTHVPTRIEIPSIGVDTVVLSPQTTDIDVLDRALLSGAVHYPGSGMVGETANMLIFGHSSYLPVVHNQAFKAFNELNKLKTGDLVHVTSSEGRSTYVVRSVRLANADEEVVYFGSTEPLLTLATCNTFGAKQERWVVSAVLQTRS